MMQIEQTDSGFAAFYRDQASAVFDLALRHCGDRRVAHDCVTTVFAQLRDHWLRVRDPVRFSRRAAVLYVRGSRRRTAARRSGLRCQPLAV